MEKVKKIKPYNVSLIIFSFFGAIPIFFSLLMLYYYFVSKTPDPPIYFRAVFEAILGSKTYRPIWSETSEELVAERALLLAIFGIGIIVWALYQFWWKKKFPKQV